MSDIEMVDNSEEILTALQNAKKRALEAIGMTGERYAKEILSETVYVDDPYRTWILTGRLRNSITYAISGENAKISEYSDIEGQTYHYQGTAPSDKEPAVYLGTNVEYAEGIETGSGRAKGGVHFLQRAATEHAEEYKQLMEESLKNA